MRNLTCWLAGLPVAWVTACAPAAPAVDVEAETQALRAAAQAYHDGAAAMDMEAVAALYAPDGVMYPPGEPTVEGMEGIREYAAAFSTVPGIQIDLTLDDVVVSSSGDLGYTLGLGQITMEGPEGQPVVEHVRDFHVWRKNANGEWKLVVDIWNSPEPPPNSQG